MEIGNDKNDVGGAVHLQNKLLLILSYSLFFIKYCLL